MKKLLSLVTFLFIYVGLSAQNEHVLAKNPTIINGKLIGITNASVKGNPIPEVLARDMFGIIRKDKRVENDEYKPTLRFKENPDFVDKSVQQGGGGINPTPAAVSLGTNYDGQGYSQVCPADPSLAVGLNHVLQMINGGSGALLQIWNKTGTSILAQKYMDAITGIGGLGDPIALYDALANRFLITEFANKPETGSEGLIISVSQTPDPTGNWFTYYFPTVPNTLFPDYPKFSVWSTGYYCKTNNFTGNTYSGAYIWAFDRTAMLAGSANASVQVFSMGTKDKFYTMCPVGLSGGSILAGDENGLFAYMNDNGFVGGGPVDSIGLVQCNVNFVTASLSTVTLKANFAVTSFSPAGPNITQPAGGQALDPLDYRIMNQPQYRNLGTSQSIVLSHLVTTSRVAGVRWYELKKTGTAWTLNQQSTYSPTNDHRFMSSININATGDIGLIYNVSSKSVYPSIKFTGRLVGDPLNSMTIAETSIINGTKVSSCLGRYGDYNHVVVDPNSGNSFWATGMYNKASSWSTRIANFSLNGIIPLIGNNPLENALVSSDVPNLVNQFENKSLISAAGIYPIPATNELNVRLNKADKSQLTITDVRGALISEVTSSSLDNKLNIAKLASGIYLLKVTTGLVTESFKFIKE